ncbi:hypothetical protein C8K30_102545 [Promicromonospora sp. AC04]|uniref:hypothetical protein n=1 Tax=Promicromonospora sp. AC04 TaxID=2135723 RepID=UPI000D4A5FB2|nr:hypothetical protein [Promicromonospora sp. AC04]PUB30163.1 hypothetical protein C8K30_102545 [Promicromonospora sp. AC04]
MLVVAIGAPEGVHPAVRRAERTLEAVVAAVADLPTDDVVLATRDERARKVARSARLVLGSERLGLLHVDTPVTAWAVVLAGLAAGGLTASAARAVTDVVLARITTRALVSSVASLESPAPTFRQHAGSLLPGTAFVVDPGRGTVGRFHERLGVPSGGDMLVVARSPRPVVPDDTDLLPRPADAELIGAEPEWHAARWLEASTIDGPLSWAVASAASGSHRWAACEVCGRAASGACIFCGLTVSSARAGLPGPAELPDQHRPEHQGVIS